MMMALTTLVAAMAAFQSPGTTPDPTRDILLTEKDAVFLMEPEVVAGSGVNRLEWSPDGTYLLVQRDALTGPNPLALLAQGKPVNPIPQGEHQFMIYSAPSRRTVTALRLPLTTSVSRVAWIPGSSKALVMAEEITRADPNAPYESVQSLYWISANGESRKIAQSNDDEYIQLFPALNRPAAVLSRSRTLVRAGQPVEEKQVLSFFDAEGRPTGTISLTDRTDEIVWASDGKVYGAFRRIEKRKLMTEWYVLSPARGTRTKVDMPTPPVEAKRAAPEFSVVSSPMPAPMKGLPSIPAVFMVAGKAAPSTKEGEFVFVSTDATNGALAPNSASVAYVHRGVAMVRPLLRLPKAAYIAMRDEALKAVAISNAKQAALALIMHASDYDDVMVSSSTDWREATMPYIKNRDVLNGFTYTFAGGSMASIENPASTPIGYTPGPGGRAVAYADGHVKWISDKP